MLQIKQGDAYNIHITLTDADGSLITDEMVDTVEITLGGIRKTYPGDVAYIPEEFIPLREVAGQTVGGYWTFPVSQEETQAMRGLFLFEARVKFTNGEVIGASLGTVDILASLSREVL